MKPKLQDVTGLTNVGWLALASAYCYIAFFAIGVGAIPWLIMSEIFPNEVRGNAAAIATAVNWLFSFIVTTFIVTTKFFNPQRQLRPACSY
mmetsp:Transcript_10457/g.8716  ORF Transcript_10457/g.8716 Transcript_10457/m.8716 type:complete len:91 (-) Transcript_10457:68-340(-)